MGGEASKPVAPPAAYNCVDDMSAADRERYHRVVARAPSSPRQTIAVIGPLHSGKSSFMNTAYRIMTNTWGEDTAGVCTSGSFAMAESFMTSAVKAVGKPEWRFRFLDTPHVLEDVARNPAEMALLRAILHGVELNTVLRDRHGTAVAAAPVDVANRPDVVIVVVDLERVLSDGAYVRSVQNLCKVLREELAPSDRPWFVVGAKLDSTSATEAEAKAALTGASMTDMVFPLVNYRAGTPGPRLKRTDTSFLKLMFQVLEYLDAGADAA